MKIGCIVQARTTSTRLPQKVLKTLDYNTGLTVLEEVIRRVKLAKKLDIIIIATTDNKADDNIVHIAQNNNIEFFRGSENDVLSRYLKAAQKYKLDHIVRITSDCPFIDPYVIDDLIDFYLDSKFDYASNCINRTYPHGLDCEVFSLDNLEKINLITNDKFYREHVTSFFYTHPENFKLGNMMLENENLSNIRITIDTKQDYALACIIKKCLSPEDVSFKNIIDLFAKYPYLKYINEDIVQKKKYDNDIEEIKEAIKLLEKQELNKSADILQKELSKRK